MDRLINLDLLSVGISVAAAGILGFAVYFNNRKSITNKTFLLFSLVTIFWGIINYATYNVRSVEMALILQRLVIFFAVWQAFFIFQLFYVFPYEKIKFSAKYKLFLVPLVIFTAILTLTPLVFNRVVEISSAGRILRIENGPGIAVFGVVSVGLVLSSVALLIFRLLRGSSIEKKQFKYILVGTIIMFSLIICFNFALPAILNDVRFIPMGAAFILPFISLTAYAIFRHHLMNVKIIMTEILTFVLATVTLIEIVVSQDIVTIILRSGVFLLVLSFGILLISGVRREVEQRERLEALTNQLEMANKKLQELDQLKSQFLSFASHQIKAPMAVVKGYAELISDGSLGEASDKIKETAVKIKDSADRMISLVSDLLNLRKIEEGKMDYRMERIDVIGLASNIIIDLKTLADKKGLWLELVPLVENAFISADPQKLRQVFQNLIENAIKYTDTGWIKVTVEIKEGYVFIYVSDSGHGISRELLPHLFEEFSRDRSEIKVGGFGLGLYIARQIIAAHKGDIWVESEGEGKGSTFGVKFPRA